MKYYLYIVSCPAYVEQDIGKIGCTTDPHSRLQSYFTSYPPHLLPYDIHYYGIWEIEADCDSDMKYKEGIIHDEFYSARKKRDISSEWFQIENFLDTVTHFIESCDFTKCKVLLNDLPHKKRSPLETVSYQKNRKLFVNKELSKNTKLNEIQAPVIEAIQNFIISEDSAGQIIAPCGSGKTNMTCKAIRHLKKIVICVPSLLIQKQWYNTLGKECVFIGGDFNNWNKECLNSDEFCIITTYASCKKLIDILPNTTELIVFDEAHHMVGLVSDNKEGGENITRALLKTLVDRNMKRLFLTFTPKDADIDDEDVTVLSMHDEKVFGKVLYQLKLRNLIQEGVLPDYLIWALSSQGKGIEGKRDQILSAWNSKQINHLIIFVKLLSEKEELVKYFKENDKDLIVLSIDDSKDSKSVIDQYTNADRAILVDCQRLGEAVDIPIADSVAIMYPIKSVVKTIQMILRPGRWYKNKSIFHVLIPHTVDENMIGIQTVLVNLAKYDEALRGELLLSGSSNKNGLTDNILQTGFSSDHCNVETISSTDIEKMNECFGNIKTVLTTKRTKKESYEFVRLCNKHLNIKTKNEYLESKTIHPKYIEDPKIYFREDWLCWYEFLSIDISMFPKTKYDFIQICKQKGINTWGEYTEKKDITLPENPSEVYEDYTNWNKEFGIHEELIIW